MFTLVKFPEYNMKFVLTSFLIELPLYLNSIPEIKSRGFIRTASYSILSFIYLWQPLLILFIFSSMSVWYAI